MIVRRLATMSMELEPVKTAMTNILMKTLEPIHIEVINESYMHNVPKGSESHFKVVVVSPKFESLTAIKRHRLVYNTVQAELGDKFPHALALVTKTPAQWEQDNNVPTSPPCKGGFGK